MKHYSEAELIEIEKDMRELLRLTATLYLGRKDSQRPILDEIREITQSLSDDLDGLLELIRAKNRKPAGEERVRAIGGYA